MNLSHGALKDLTAHAELKAKGGILERHSLLLLKAHAVSERYVDVPSLDGFRMALRVKRMGALAEEVVYLGNSSGRFLCGPFFFRFDFGILKPIYVRFSPAKRRSRRCASRNCFTSPERY